MYFFLAAGWLACAAVFLTLVTVVPESESARSQAFILSLVGCPVCALIGVMLSFNLPPFGRFTNPRVPWWFELVAVALGMIMLIVSIG